MDRVTVAEAAERLGVTQDAVRQRIRRGTIDHEKDETGRVYVYLTPTDTARDNVRDGAHDTDRDDLVGELRDRIRYLEEESRRKDAILLTMAQRIPELEPAKEGPPEPRESPVNASEERGGGEDHRGQEKPVSWWRRLFGE